LLTDKKQRGLHILIGGGKYYWISQLDIQLEIQTALLACTFNACIQGISKMSNS